MSFTIACPSCAASMQAPEAAAGKRVSCPKCRQPFIVPNPPSRSEPPLEREPPRVANPAPFDWRRGLVEDDDQSQPAAGIQARRPELEPVAEVGAAHCISCGRPLHNQLTCRYCAAVLCSERCLSEHLQFAHSDNHLRFTNRAGKKPSKGNARLLVALLIAVVCIAPMLLCFGVCSGLSRTGDRRAEKRDEAPLLQLPQFLYPTTANGPKGVSRPDLIGKEIQTYVAVSVFHDQSPGKDNPDRLKVICGTFDEKDVYMLLVEFLPSQKKEVQALKGHDLISVRGVLNQRGEVTVLEQAELLKAVRP